MYMNINSKSNVNELLDKVWAAMVKYNGGEDDFLCDDYFHGMAEAIAKALCDK